MVTTFLAWQTILFICYSRVYVGRHSIDQVINGALLGYLLAEFSHDHYRTQIFEKSIRKDLTSQEHWT